MSWKKKFSVNARYSVGKSKSKVRKISLEPEVDWPEVNANPPLESIFHQEPEVEPYFEEANVKNNSVYFDRLLISKQWWTENESNLLLGWQNSMSPGDLCDCCSQPILQPNDAHRCLQCKIYTMCKNCSKIIHNFQPMAVHSLQKWSCNESKFIPSTLLDIIPCISCQHISNLYEDEEDKVKSKLVNLIGYFGNSKDVKLVHCNLCIPGAALLQNGYFPTNKNCTMAIDTELPMFLRSIVLESKTSLYLACNAFCLRNLPFWVKENSLYRTLKCDGAWEAFLTMVWKLQDQKMLECPCCHKADHIFVCLDACFGLKRKKSASKYEFGCNIKGAMSTSTLADNAPYRLEHNMPDSETRCSHFRAAESVVNPGAASKLVSFGVFGAACRHETWIAIRDMQTSGESLSYSVNLVQDIVKQHGAQSLDIIYDIGCKLEPHFKSLNLQNKFCDIAFRFMVPTFHAYGHDQFCREKYGIRTMSNVGLTDGETMERRWSALRPFGPMTKEMSASNRSDLLSLVLYHENQKKCIRITSWIRSRTKLFRKALDHSIAGLHDIKQQICNNDDNASLLNDETIMLWEEEEKLRCATEKSHSRSCTTELLPRLHSLAVAFSFARKQRAKCHGQSSLRITLRLEKAAKQKMKKNLEIYNRFVSEERHLTMNDVLSPDAAIFNQLNDNDNSIYGVPRNIRLEAIAHSRLRKRAMEEPELLKQDKLCASYYLNEEIMRCSLTDNNLCKVLLMNKVRLFKEINSSLCDNAYNCVEEIESDEEY